MHIRVSGMCKYLKICKFLGRPSPTAKMTAGLGKKHAR